MATASSMIIRALQMIGEKRIGGTLTSDEQTAFLAVLNSMLESWSLERLMCYHILNENFSLVAGTASYTIGSGGTFNTARPNKIVKAYVRDSSNYDSPVTIIDSDAYHDIGLKSSGNTYPEYLFYDTGFSSSLGTIYLYPKPSDSLTLYIDSWKQLQSFAAVGDSVTLPPGYQRAIESNLAIELAPGYIAISDEIAKIARESKAAVKGINSQPPVMSVDPALSRTFGSNILTGP